MKIWKFKLPSKKVTSFIIPHVNIHRVLHCGLQDGVPYFWALAEKFEYSYPKHIHTLETGDEDPYWQRASCTFIGTILLDEGAYVLHYYLEQ